MRETLEKSTMSYKSKSQIIPDTITWTRSVQTLVNEVHIFLKIVVNILLISLIAGTYFNTAGWKACINFDGVRRFSQTHWRK